MKQLFFPYVGVMSGILVGVSLTLVGMYPYVHMDIAAVHGNDHITQDDIRTLEDRTPPPETPPESTHQAGPDMRISTSSTHTPDSSLAGRVRVLCWVLTTPASHQTKAVAVNKTWGRRCDVLLFMSDVTDESLPTIGLGTELGRKQLTTKTRKAFDYVYKNHFDDADWFLKADDDTYVIVENLRHMLSAHAPTDPVYFGEPFIGSVRQGIFSGGAGYVLSKEALRRYGQRDPHMCTKDLREAEDLFMGKCMLSLDVVTGDARDEMGRARFHCLQPAAHLHGDYELWYYKLSKYQPKQGIANMSEYPISFHYVTPSLMQELDYYIYHIKVYAGQTGRGHHQIS